MKKLQVLLLLVPMVSTTVAFQSNIAQAQQIARMRFTWDYPDPPNGAIYMNICADPNFNIDAQSGGCAKVNVLNSNVTKERSGTRLVEDRLKAGVPYKACLVADSVYQRTGRWIECQIFRASDGTTIAFSYHNLRFVRNRH